MKDCILDVQRLEGKVRETEASKSTAQSSVSVRRRASWVKAIAVLRGFLQWFYTVECWLGDRRASGL